MYASSTGCRLRYGLSLVVIVGLLSGCAVTEKSEPRVEVERNLLDDPRLVKMRIHAPFDDAWSGVNETLQEQGLREREAKRSARRKTYTTTLSLEDQPRDRTLREMVTEGYGELVAETGDGALVALELQEAHRWRMSALQRINSLAGGDEDRTLEHEGVLSTVPPGYTNVVDPAATRGVFDALVQRFSE